MRSRQTRIGTTPRRCEPRRTRAGGAASDCCGGGTGDRLEVESRGKRRRDARVPGVARVQAIAGQLRHRQLTDLGHGLTVTFKAPTNRAARAFPPYGLVGTWACDRLFVARAKDGYGTSPAQCVWKNARVVFLLFGRDANVTYDATLYLRDDVLQACDASSLARVHIYIRASIHTRARHIIAPAH